MLTTKFMFSHKHTVVKTHCSWQMLRLPGKQGNLPMCFFYVEY